MTLDIAHLQSWIGRAEWRDDELTLQPVAALSAVLDRDDPPPKAGDPLPPLWHWLYFLPTARQSELGDDGHARRGGFLPPVPLERRMWAGSRLEFLRPLRLGARVARRSRIARVDHKQGRAGPLVFVQVEHEIADAEGAALREVHDIVYRDKPAGSTDITGAAAPQDHAWRREIRPDPVLLFRYSALTFNGHRIHYDHPYVTRVEQYPGLVVHGPLIATLLLDLLRRERPDAVVRRFSFRAVSPLFDTGPFHIYGKPDDAGGTVKLWAAAADGRLAMEAAAELARD